MIVFIVLAILASVPLQAPAKQTPPAPDPLANAPRVSLELKGARFSDVVHALGAKYGLAIVADAYLNDTPMPHLRIDDLPLPVAVHQIGAQFGRDTLVQNGVIIYRHPRPLFRLQQDATSARAYNMKWQPDAGRCEIRRLLTEASAPASGEPKPAASVPPRPSGVEGYVPPARWLSGRVTAAPLGRVAAALAKESGWSVTVDSDIADRRVSMVFDRLTPGQVMEALALLVGGRQRVAILLSKEDRVNQEAQLAAALDQRSELEKRSDELMAKLEPYLTEAERQTLANGGRLEKAFSDLPAGLRGLAESYMHFSADGIRKQGIEFPELDMSRLGEFRLLIDTRNRAIGIDGYTTSGRRVVF